VEAGVNALASIRRDVSRSYMPLTRVFHLAEADNWPSIQKHGLLCATALSGLAGNSEADRARVMHHRATRTVLSNGAVVRDQTPMPPSALRACLHGMTPDEWYALLNSKVFFWADVERLKRHMHACRRYPQVVMVLDAAALLSRYSHRAAVSPFNTGNARRRPASRGRTTFVPYLTWCESGWRHEAEGLGTRPRAGSHRPAELTVAGAVPDVMDFVVDIRQVASGEKCPL
jgi:hypothetical protein